MTRSQQIEKDVAEAMADVSMFSVEQNCTTNTSKLKMAIDK